MTKRRFTASIATAFASGALLTAGVGHTFASFSDFQVVHAQASAGTWGPDCLAKGEKQPTGEPKLPKCPPAPPPGQKCQENVLDSESPASKQTDPIDTVPVTLSATYHDESAMDTVTNPPTLTIDGADQSSAWGTSLTVTDDTSNKNDYRTTVGYTVPSSFGDGDLHTFVITFYDTDKSLGCGEATFYVQYPPAGPPSPSGTCHEDVLDSQSPDSTSSQPITEPAAKLTAVYTDEKPLNTTTLLPTLSIDGVDQANAFPSAFEPVDTATKTGSNYVTAVTYDVPSQYADGNLHTFVVTLYDGDDNGCGVATFYVKATP